MIQFAGDASVFVINHEDFVRSRYEEYFHDHHLTECIPEGAQHHLLPVDLLQVYDLDYLRSGGYESETPAAVFVFDPQDRASLEQLSPQLQQRYHLSIIGDSRCYVVQRSEWFLSQAKADFQSPLEASGSPQRGME